MTWKLAVLHATYYARFEKGYQWFEDEMDWRASKQAGSGRNFATFQSLQRPLYLLPTGAVEHLIGQRRLLPDKPFFCWQISMELWKLVQTFQTPLSIAKTQIQRTSKSCDPYPTKHLDGLIQFPLISWKRSRVARKATAVGHCRSSPSPMMCRSFY